MMMASSVPMATTSDVLPFPRGFAWRSASPPAMELTDHLHQLEMQPTTPSASSESSPRASPTVTPTHKPSTFSSRPNMTASSTITLAMLRPHFEEPLAQVAQRFGICVTLLKKICRRHGIARWPHRQISGLRKSIASMEHAIGYFEGARRESYAVQLNKQRAKLELLLRDPTAPSLLSPSTNAANAAGSAKFHDGEEEEDERDSMGSPKGVAFMYDGDRRDYGHALPSSVSPSAYSQAYYHHDRHSMPEAFARHSPGRYEAAPPLPPLQGVLRPEFPTDQQHLHYQQRQHEYEQRYYRPSEHDTLYSREYAEQQATRSAVPDIPPLRMEPKPLLPPISSLVVPASGGARVSW